MPPSTEHSFPASHALQLVTLLQRWDVPATELLDPYGLDEKQLAQPHARIPGDTMLGLTRRARTLSGEPGLGFYLGLQKRLTMYGYLGFATMSASTVGEGLDLITRYAPTISTALGFTLEVDGHDATLTIVERMDVGDVHDVLLLSLLVGIRQLTATITGLDNTRVAIDLSIDRPDYFERFAHLLPDATFGHPTTRIRFDARGLEQALLNPDRAALELARQACERQLEELGFDHHLPARVRRVLATPTGYLNIESAADALHMSTRTLKRKLAAQDVTFSSLLDAERKQHAQELLRAADPPLEEVATRLDYASLPNFARAFRRWTGETPAQYRRRHR